MPRPRTLTDVSQIDPLLTGSHERPAFVFKHSLTCPISANAHQEYLRFVDRHGGGEKADFTLVEIQKARDVSHEIARRTGVRHESPQAILLHRGEPVWHASHYSIRARALDEALEKAAG